jgi:UDP-glucose 4-epimerase
MGKILITGGCGYIGSHFVNYCLDNKIFKKENLIIVDNLENGRKENIPKNVMFYEIDLKNEDELEKIFKENEIISIFHFAAYVQVNESVKNPEKYFLNNTLGTLNLVDLMSKYNVKNLIFSSTAAVYGNPLYTPVDESHQTNPENPYGSSKLNSEEIIKQYSKWKGLKAIALRYFNVIGNYYSFPTNEQGLPFALIKALKDDKILYIFGNDYNTKDGTAIRDYINVLDLVEAHLKAYEFLKHSKNDFEVINLGTNKGYTVLEVVNTFNEILKEKNLGQIKYKIIERREGDVEKLVASNEKAKKLLNWQPKRNLKESLKSLIDFVLKNG